MFSYYYVVGCLPYMSRVVGLLNSAELQKFKSILALGRFDIQAHYLKRTVFFGINQQTADRLGLIYIHLSFMVLIGVYLCEAQYTATFTRDECSRDTIQKSIYKHAIAVQTFQLFYHLYVKTCAFFLSFHTKPSIMEVDQFNTYLLQCL